MDGFGIFSDVSVENLSPGLSIFLGENEAGKSTCLEFLRTMNANDRADAIINHYQWIDSLKDADLVKALTGPQEQSIVEFHVGH